MTFSLRTLFFVTLATGLCMAYISRPTPVDRLRSIEAVLASGEPVNSLLVDVNDLQPMDFFLATINVSEIDRVNTIWFSPDREVTENHLRLLCKFPNLRAIHFAGNYQPEWLRHLQDCQKLELVSLNNSNASDASIPYLIEIPNIRMIFTDGTSVTENALVTFEESGDNRFANVYFSN